jgi:hypothetical protein
MIANQYLRVMVRIALTEERVSCLYPRGCKELQKGR